MIMAHIYKCLKCNEYTLREVCKKCGEKTSKASPARYSPQDKYSKYRREVRLSSKDENKVGC